MLTCTLPYGLVTVVYGVFILAEGIETRSVAYQYFCFGWTLSGEESVVFGFPESTRKEEKEIQINQSYQVTDHLLAETAECLHAVEVGNTASSWFL